MLSNRLLLTQKTVAHKIILKNTKEIKKTNSRNKINYHEFLKLHRWQNIINGKN